MAEKMLPVYEQAREVRDQSVAGLDADSKRRVIKGKVGAEQLMDVLTPVLFPEDDDG